MENKCDFVHIKIAKNTETLTITFAYIMPNIFWKLMLLGFK